MKKPLLILMLVSVVFSQIVFRQSTDTLKLVCRNNQNVESWQWYYNNVAVSGASDSVYTIYADSAFYSIKHVIYCLVNGSVKSGEWKFQFPGIINRKITIGPNLKIY